VGESIAPALQGLKIPLASILGNPQGIKFLGSLYSEWGAADVGFTEFFFLCISFRFFLCVTKRTFSVIAASLLIIAEVPIIPLPSIGLSSFASRHAGEWFHIGYLCPTPAKVKFTATLSG
jgi:hypothetical protein